MLIVLCMDLVRVVFSILTMLVVLCMNRMLIVVSILTTVIAFIPLLFIPGEMGMFWKPLPIVVIVVLLVSLVEALLILPSHLAHTPRRKTKRGILLPIHKLQQFFLRGFEWFVNHVYRRFLDGALKYRYVTIVGAVVLFLVEQMRGDTEYLPVNRFPNK